MCDITYDAQMQQCCPNASFPRRASRIRNLLDYFLGKQRCEARASLRVRQRFEFSELDEDYLSPNFGKSMD
jgi:hypothetical protein